MNTSLYALLLLLTVVIVIGGFVTLIPASGASYENVLGYRSVCTFAPAAAFYCFFFAGLTCFFRSSFVKDRHGSPRERFKRHARALVPLIAVLLLAAGSTVWFSIEKARYVDSATGATLTGQETE